MSEMNEERRGRGRPRKGELRDQTFIMKLSKSDRELLNKLSEEEDLPAAQIVRRAVKMYSNYYRP
jgi:hypothetical protein